jgi:RND family efflux transporter MFP subunit
MKRIITLLIVVASLVGIGYTLYANKKEVDARAQVKDEQKNIPVNIAAVSLQTLNEDLTLIGTFEPLREVRMLSEVSGKVVKMGIKEGDVVKEGSLVAQTDNELIRAELMAAEAAYNKLKKDVARFENLVKGDAVTEAQLEDVRLGYKQAEARVLATRKQLKNTTITAPISGTVTSRSFEYGSLLMPGAPVASITDISKVKLRILVPEQHIFKLKEGQTIAVKSDVYSSTDFTGTITMVGVKGDAAHNYPVEILVDNKQQQLRAGMYGRAILNNLVTESTLTIPRSALVGSFKNPQVYVAEGGKAVLRNIKVGASARDLVQVTDGLKEGEQVITAGQINLENNMTILVSNK